MTTARMIAAIAPMRSRAIDSRAAWSAHGLRHALKQRRLAAGLTQADVAKEAGYEQAQIAGWERGYVAPHFAQLDDWCQALGLSLFCAPPCNHKKPGSHARMKRRECIPVDNLIPIDKIAS